MHIAVIGLGKLGLPLSLVMAKYHREVLGIDLDINRLEEIKVNKKTHEPLVNEYYEKYKNKIHLTTNYEELKFFNPDAIFVVVQTPSKIDETFDIYYVEIAIYRARKFTDAPIYIVSTVNPGDTERLNKKYGRVYYNPEMVAQGRIIHDMENPNYILIGCENKRDLKIIQRIWSKITDAPQYVSSTRTIELAKISLNVSLITQIMMANVIGGLADKMECDSKLILELVWKDIRKYRQGLGASGPCFPRDLALYKVICARYGHCLGERVINSLIFANKQIIYDWRNEIKKEAEKMKKDKVKVGVVGVAYKPYVPYLYASQSLEIIRTLLYDKFDINIWDAIKEASEDAKKQLDNIKKMYCLDNEIKVYDNLQEMIDNSDIIFIGLPFKEIKEANLKNKIVIDPWGITNEIFNRDPRS